MSRPSLLARLGLLLASFAFVVAVAEVALRVVWRGPTGDAEAAAGFSLRKIAEPNLEGVFLGVPFRTNARGVRGPDFKERPAPGVFRILFGGDSVTMGWRVAEEDAYPMVVERALNEGNEGRTIGGADLRFEVVNAGLAGLNISGVMDRMESHAPAYAPDLLVYGYTINDIEGPAYRKPQSPRVAMRLMQRHNRYGESPSYVVRFVWPRLSALQERISPSLAPYSQTLHDNYFANPDAWRAVEGGLDRLASLARRLGVCAHLLVHTELSKLERDEHDYLDIYAGVEAAARARGITVSQSFAAFEGRDGEALKAAFLDSHPGPEGHVLLAQALLEGLSGLPAECVERRTGEE